jgi:Na+/alanine symporter
MKPAVRAMIQIFAPLLHTAFVINTTVFIIMVTGVAAHPTMSSALNTKYQHIKMLIVHIYVTIYL